MDKRKRFIRLLWVGLFLVIAGWGIFPTAPVIGLPLFLAGAAIIVLTPNPNFVDNDEDNEDEDIEEPKEVSSFSYTNSPIATQGTLTETEKEVWDSLTTEVKDENFDPPIALEWETLNPFKRKDKKDKKR